MIESDKQKVLEVVRDFNTRGEHAELAQKMLSIIINSVEPEELFTIRAKTKLKRGSETGLMDQIMVYSGKHKRRY